MFYGVGEEESLHGKLGLGAESRAAIMQAPLAAVSLETAIQTQKKTVLDC